MITEMRFPTSQEAWVQVNKGLVEIESNPNTSARAKIYKHQVLLYDVLLRIDRSYIDPEWDFTKTVNYRRQKWTSLVGNYVDINHLEDVLGAVKHRELKKHKNYNETFHFGNAHSHGKGCLLVCTFSRRYGEDRPVLNAVMRAAEFFKRGMMDLLLLHRIGEQAYGDEPFAVNIFAQQLWGGSDWLSLIYAFDKKYIKGLKNAEGFAGEVYKKYKLFKNVEDIGSISYHAHQRAAKVIQGLTATPALLAEDCELY